jgi:cardiolipin synthase A/B
VFGVTREFDIVAGERTIIAQYCRAIRLAQRTIYREHQSLELPEVVEALHGALQRGVEVVLVLPAQPDMSPTASTLPERRAFFETRAALAEYPNFTLVGLVGQDDVGQRHAVWIHSKVMLIDDHWGTVGSANLHRFSAVGNGEVNATFWEPQTARAFRVELFWEHLAADTSEIDDVEALRLLGHLA